MEILITILVIAAYFAFPYIFKIGKHIGSQGGFRAGLRRRSWRRR